MADSEDGGTVTPLKPRHISERMARAFYENTLAADEAHFVVRHLIQRCSKCVALMSKAGIDLGAINQEALSAFGTPLPTVPKELGVRRILGISQLAILQGVSEGRQQFISEQQELHSLGLYERLVEAAISEFRRDPLKAVENAHLALEVASHLPVSTELRHDYMATATALYANGSRLNSDFAGAETALTAAKGLAEEGTADPLVSALVERYFGAYYFDIGEVEKAENAYGAALHNYQLAGDEHLQGRTLLSVACVVGNYDPQRALLLLGRAAVLFDPLAEPMLEFALRHNEIWCTNEAGAPEQALTMLERSRDLYLQFTRLDQWNRFRMYWLEGRIALNLGQSSEAIKIFRMLFRSVEQEGKHPVDLTLIGVDLMHAMSVHGGLQREISAFAETLLMTTKHLGLHAQGRAIILLLRQQLLKTTLEAARWLEIKRYLRFRWRVALPEQPYIVPTS